MTLATDKWTHQLVAFIQVAFIGFGTPILLFIDSPWFAIYVSEGQDISNAIMIGYYGWLLWLAKPRLYFLIILMTLTGLVAEFIGSLILTLYHYRLHNIPLYIPLGHAVIFATVYNFDNYPWIWKHHQNVEYYLAKVTFVTVLTSLFLLNDVAGFILYLLFLIILHTRQKRLFYLAMFMLTYYIELFGTIFSTWSWYGVVGNHPALPPIGYTPSGVPGLYVLIDLVCCLIYFYIRKVLYHVSLWVRWLKNAHPQCGEMKVSPQPIT